GGDKLLISDGWQAQSHIGLRVPEKNPAARKLEPIASVGVVLHLADVEPGAELIIELNDKNHPKVRVQLKDVFAGKTQILWFGAGAVRLISTSTLVNNAQTEDDFPAAAYGPDGTLWVAYTSYTLLDEGRRIEQQNLSIWPENFKSYYTPGFRDQLWLKAYRAGKWTTAIPVTGSAESIVRCAVAVEDNGNVCVVYSAMRYGRHDLFYRSHDPKTGKWHSETRLTQKGLANLSPVACTKRDGSLCIAFQHWTQTHATTGLISGRAGSFGPLTMPSGKRNVWSVGLVADGAGNTTVVFDTYEAGDFDIGLADVVNAKPASTMVTDTARFEARPSGVYDSKGRLWIAYEEGPQRWGKDYGALDNKGGHPLYDERHIRVICRDTNGQLYQPVAKLPQSRMSYPVLPFDSVRMHSYESAARYAYPHLGVDGKGQLWLTYRQGFGSRFTSHPGSYWLTFARRLEGDTWSEPIELHHSDGLLDNRPALLPHKNGGLVVIHNTDGRYTTPEVVQNKVYMSVISLPGEVAEPQLVPLASESRSPVEAAKVKKERDTAAVMEGYRVDSGGKRFQLLRGEFHRHTEFSFDGGGEGSLDDMFRYAIDAAALDWIGNGDHDGGGGREYAWWLIQKFTDAYHLPDLFTTMFSYERSVPYPHGHRNCMFAKRGVRTLPRLLPAENEATVAGVSLDDTKMLYRYLHEMDGLCAAHSTATNMGTDWRDNDPVAEPIVEIYQGDRMSYEVEGAPRAGYKAGTGKLPVNVAGWYPFGYVDLALKKGYKLGFQASSDHWSTHISFFVILSEKRDRESLLAAVRKRHCYGATDNIIVNLRSGPFVMGDEFKASGAPKLDIEVIGTNTIAKIDILRDSEVVQTIYPKADRYTGNWTDLRPAAGTHYYYIRVLQTDEQLAWASPMWITS
ncbi:MAG TPA: hypothetical protein VE988_22940, partial [Gemmataceae bacterium]|nr:hypothetical protein [Gemmataceae bacterium]